MSSMSTHAHAARARLLPSLAALTSAVAVPWLALAPAAMGGTAAAASSATTQIAAIGVGVVTGQSGQSTLPGGKPTASATLEQCATATVPQTERAATFSGEMSAIPGTARMEIRVDLEERAAGELLYRAITAPGLGVWHSSAAGVKVFTHIQQVTNLSAPALYRGVLRFRWLNAKGRPLKAEVSRTAVCEQPAAPAETPSSTGTPGTTPTGSTSAGAASTGASG
jgi:hypothetical protein